MKRDKEEMGVEERKGEGSRGEERSNEEWKLQGNREGWREVEKEAVMDQ